MTRGSRLVSVEVALTVAMTMMAALMGRSLLALRAVPLGFNPDGVVIARVSLPSDRYASETSQRAFFESLLARMRTMTEVTAAGTVSVRPLGGMGPATPVSDPANPLPDGAAPVADIRVIDDGALSALGVPLLAGRTFDRAAAERAAPQAIVTKDLADRLWPGRDPIGRAVTAQIYGGITGEIVGVTAAVHLIGPRTAARPCLYLSAAQFPSSQRDLVVRTGGLPERAIPALREALAGVDRSVPLYLVAPLSDLAAEAVSSERFSATILSAFATAALLLVAIGVFGVCASEVASRRREIGVRVALGSPAWRVLVLLIADALRRVVWGIAVGAVVALLLADAMRSLMFGVTPFDAPSLVLVTGLVLAVAVTATLFPAAEALHRSPLAVLREE